MKLNWLSSIVFLVPAFIATTLVAEEASIRVGMIGLDTSHVVAYAKIMNDPNAPEEIRGVRVAYGFPGGSDDFPLSRDRVEGFTEQLSEMGVEIVDSLEALVEKSDAVMVMSVDGRPHLAQAEAALAAKKPVFVDKPFAASLEDVVAIFVCAEKHGTPCFGSSSSRFSPGYAELTADEAIGRVFGCDAYSQCRAAPHHPDVFWYGCHGVELLHTILGPGCKTVTAAQTPYTETVTGIWSDGRVGTFRGIREHTHKTGLGVTVFGEKKIVHHDQYYDYRPLVMEIAHFFKSGRPPVTPEETISVFAFMAAAEESKRQGGEPVSVEEVLKTAKEKQPIP